MNNALVPIAAEPQPELALGYYAATRKVPLKHWSEKIVLQKGQVVFVLSVEEGKAHFQRGNAQYSMAIEEFTEAFAPDPDGAANRAAEVAALMAEVGVLQAESLREEMAARALNPHVERTGTELVTTQDAAVDATKRSMAEIRNSAERVRRDLASRAGAIKAFAEEQAAILYAQTASLQEVLKKAQEAVWTINLYLGSEEVIERLREGESAAPKTPITLRQLVLYMDEECAVAAEDGGLDARSIDRFDAWLLEDPAHLQQVLPEPKGLVVLKPRRKNKDYGTGDPWTENQLNKANRVTYFLLRNGENLYRMWTNWDVGERFIPRTDEFLKYFVEERFNFETRTTERTRLEPGSSAWMEAEKRADGQRRHYMRAALILQGLLDRTTIFAPLSGPINVNDPAAYDGPLSVVLDGDIMLADGHERFEDWIRRINGELAVGNRVIGAWNSWDHGLRGGRDSHERGNSRLSPAMAEYPSDEAIYTIEEKRDGEFLFYYKRREKRWVDYGERNYRQRASCRILPTDQFVLNFDAVTQEDLHYYMNSRLDRHHYLWMFPTLKNALRMKRAEAKQEAPFALLLAGEIAKAHGVDVATAAAAVPGLIHWWKYKNRTHRALTADDAKALRMIVTEYGRQAEQEDRRTAREAQMQQVADMIQAAEPNAILIAHKSDNNYVALIPANDENIFVHEQSWNTQRCTEVKEWTVVDERFRRWFPLRTGSGWADWRTGTDRRLVLSDPERDALLEKAWERAARTGGWTHEAHPINRLGVTLGKQDELYLYWTRGEVKIPTALLLTSDRPSGPDLRMGTVGWDRHGSEVRLRGLNEHGIIVGANRAPWESEYWQAKRVLWSDPVAMAVYREQERQVAVAEARVHALQEVANGYFVNATHDWNARAEAAAYAKFLDDYGDPDLWEGHKKALKLPNAPRMEGLRKALAILVERGFELSPGTTVREVLQEAGSLTGKHIDEDDAVLGLVVAP